MTFSRVLRRCRRLTAGCVAGLIAVAAIAWVRAQGPREAYYYQPATTLPWAHASAYQQGGSSMTVPFLPVIDSRVHAPFGTANLTRDISVDGPLVFVGDGIVKAGGRNAYVGRRPDFTDGDIDVAGRIVLFCYDAPDADEAVVKEYTLGRRIEAAAARRAAAVVVFSAQRAYPFPSAQIGQDASAPAIPAVAVTLESAMAILDSAGYDGRSAWKEWQQTKKAPASSALISRMRIQMTGRFDSTDSGRFVLRYLPGSFPREQMAKIAATNEKAVTFLLEVFRESRDVQWKKLTATYFRDYDSKVFYTHHWGSGWSTPEGTYLVTSGNVPSYPLAVHENAHAVVGSAWGGSSSFLAEGIGKYTEALASDPQINDRTTIGYLASGRFFRLSDMLDFTIGLSGLKTDVGYPAAGSFVGFVVKRHGLARLKQLYQAEARVEKTDDETPWRTTFGKTIGGIETEWLEWLATTYPADAPAIRRYLASISS